MKTMWNRMIFMNVFHKMSEYMGKIKIHIFNFIHIYSQPSNNVFTKLFTERVFS